MLSRNFCGLQVHDRLVQMASYFPVADQKDGSYLTITSDSGIQFMFIFFLSGLSQMLVRIWLLSSALTCSISGSLQV